MGLSDIWISHRHESQRGTLKALHTTVYNKRSALVADGMAARGVECLGRDSTVNSTTVIMIAIKTQTNLVPPWYIVAAHSIMLRLS